MEAEVFQEEIRLPSAVNDTPEVAGDKEARCIVLQFGIPYSPHTTNEKLDIVLLKRGSPYVRGGYTLPVTVNVEV